jgi:hypothetical protein
MKDPSTDLSILRNCSNQRNGGKVVHRFVKSLLGSKKNIVLKLLSSLMLTSLKFNS